MSIETVHAGRRRSIEIELKRILQSQFKNHDLVNLRATEIPLNGYWYAGKRIIFQVTLEEKGRPAEAA